VAANRWILAENRRLRLSTLFILYVAQGVPIGLFWFAIPAWMAANGAGASDIGYVLALTALPWTLKFVNGFIMDRYTFLAMGRRRIWIVGAQMIMIALLVGCALIRPGVTDILLLGMAGFIVNRVTTFQDVGVDGLAVDIMKGEERAREWDDVRRSGDWHRRANRLLGFRDRAARPIGALSLICKLRWRHHAVSAPAQGATRRAAGAVERG
jgi:PAT family beta-lactamase induction signal transducer AmpG